MIGDGAALYIYWAYGVAGALLAAAGLYSWLGWRRLRADYKRLYERKTDA